MYPRSRSRIFQIDKMLVCFVATVLMVSITSSELVHKKRPFHIPSESFSIEKRLSRASFTPTNDKEGIPFSFPTNSNLQDGPSSSDKHKSHLITFPTSTENVHDLNIPSIAQRSPKQNSVQIVQNYSEINVFNATNPRIDSNKLESSNLIEYLNYIHQLSPEDAAAALQPKITKSNKNSVDNDKKRKVISENSLQIEKERSTESPIETLNKLRQTLHLSTTPQPSTKKIQGDMNDFSSSQVPSFSDKVEDETESPLETLNKIHLKLSPFLITTTESAFIISSSEVQIKTSHSQTSTSTGDTTVAAQTNETLDLNPIENYLQEVNQTLSNSSVDENSSHVSSAIHFPNDGTRSKENISSIIYSETSIGTLKSVLLDFHQPNKNDVALDDTKIADEEDTTKKTEIIGSNQDEVSPLRPEFQFPDTKSLDTHVPDTKQNEIKDNEEVYVKIEHVDNISRPVGPSEITFPVGNIKISNSSNVDTTMMSEQDTAMSSNTATDFMHNFESIEIGVVVGVAIGLFIVFLCCGSLMLCFQCGKRKNSIQGKESTLTNATGDCGNVGCSGSSSGSFFFGGRRNVYATMEHTNGESGVAENQLGYTSIYPKSGYFRKSGPPVLLPHELMMNYDDGTTDSITTLPSPGRHQNIELSYNYSKPIDLNKRSQSDKVTEL